MKTTLHFLAGPNWPWQSVPVSAGDPVPNVGDIYQTLTNHPTKIVSRTYSYNQDGTTLMIIFNVEAL